MGAETMSEKSELLSLASQIEHDAEAIHNRAMLGYDEDNYRIARRAEDIMRLAHELQAKVRDGEV